MCGSATRLGCGITAGQESLPASSSVQADVSDLEFTARAVLELQRRRGGEEV